MTKVNAKNLKITYLALWVVTGILLGVTISGLFIYFAFLTNNRVFEEASVWLLGILLGLVFGLTAGPYFWQKIYIDGARGKKYVVKK